EFLCGGGEIKVNITENLDELKNEDMVIAVGSEKTVKYEYQTKNEMIQNYFKIVDEANIQLISLLNKQKVTSSEYFPIYAFSSICNRLSNVKEYKNRQLAKLISLLKSKDYEKNHKNTYLKIDDIIANLTEWKHVGAIIYGVLDDNIKIEDLKNYLMKTSGQSNTEYRKLLCLYDYLSY
ncbi:SIR2 family protein, partial [Serratia sp. CY74308]